MDQTRAVLDLLPEDVRTSARIDSNGEVSWRLEDVPRALAALSDARLVVLGLDTRSYEEDGGIIEIPFADFSSSPMTPEQARDEALSVLSDYAGELGDWILITWR